MQNGTDSQGRRFCPETDLLKLPRSADSMSETCHGVTGQRKRLSFVIPAHWTGVMGGSEYQALLLIQALNLSQRYDIYYLARYVDQTFRVESHQVIKIADETRVRRYGLFFDAPRLLGVLKRIKPDIIYQRVGCAYTGVAAYYARRHHCKLIWHISNDTSVLPFVAELARDIVFRYIEKKVLE